MTFQYRIRTQDTFGEISEVYPSEQWAWSISCAEDRGLYVALERRLITDKEILPMLTDKAGYMVIGDKVACPWEILAEGNYA
jgi:hypothetical protein